MLFRNKRRIKVDVEESGYTFRRITRQYSSVRNTPWKCGATRMKNLRYSIHSVTYIHRANEGERKQYVFDPTTPSGGLWYKLKQVWNGKWRRHAKERQEEADSSREREREKKGVARVSSSSSSFWASNWNNGNWLTSNEYSIGLFEQWEKNIRRRACVDTTKDMYVTFPIPSSGSLGNTRENGEKRKKGSG